MSTNMLAGKRICIVHPAVIHLDHRLSKTVKTLLSAEVDVTIVCSAEMNTEQSEYESLAHVKKIASQDANLIQPSNHKIWLMRVLYNLCIYQPIRNLQKRKKPQRDPFKSFGQMICQEEFDVVHFINYPLSNELIYLRKKSSVPIIYESYENWPEVFKDGQVAMSTAESEKWLLLEQLAVKKSNACIVVGEQIAKVYHEYNKKISYPVIHNVAPSKPLAPSPLNTPISFYYQGYFRRGQGIENALLAFALCKGEFTVTLQGNFLDAEYELELHNKIRELGLSKRVTFLPKCNYSDVVEAANVHDIGFLTPPLLTNGLVDKNSKVALPNKLFVYASGGLAMVFGKQQKAIREILEKTPSAFFVDTESTKDIQKCFQALINNPQTVRNMKQSSAAWAQQYSPEAESMKVIDVYCKLLMK